MAVELQNIKVTVMAATYIAVKDRDGKETTEKVQQTICLQIDDASKKDVAEWLRIWTKDNPEWRKTPAAISLRKWYKKRTVDQLKLFWSLVKVMTLEAEGKNDAEIAEQYYHGLLNLYAPRTTYRIPGGGEGEAIKTLSQMNTLEVSRVIEGAFRELSIMGVHLSSSEVKNWYLEWRTWRGKLKLDGLESTYQSLQDYRERVPFCEASLKHLGPTEGHLAHIVSRGASGESDETWNYLHLSAEVHIGLQHTKGWVEMLSTYPHLMGKVNAARRFHGMEPIGKPEDLYDDLLMKDGDESNEKAPGAPTLSKTPPTEQETTNAE